MQVSAKYTFIDLNRCKSLLFAAHLFHFFFLFSFSVCFRFEVDADSLSFSRLYMHFICFFVLLILVIYFTDLLHFQNTLSKQQSYVKLNKLLIQFIYNFQLKQCRFFNKTAQTKKRISITRSSPPEVFLRKGVLKRCSKFTGEHPGRSVISTILLCNFIEITPRHECSSVNLLHIFRTPFPKNIYGGLLPHQLVVYHKLYKLSKIYKNHLIS